METETTAPQQTRPDRLGPTGMELRPELPQGRGLSKRGGVLAILAVGALVALIIYGIFSRQGAATEWGKRRGDSDKRVTGAKEAAKQFSSPPGNPVEDDEPKDQLEPPPLNFMPRGRDGKPLRVAPSQVAPRDTGRALQAGVTGSNTVPAALRTNGGQVVSQNYAVGRGGAAGVGPTGYQGSGQGGQGGQPAGWDSPAAWGGVGPGGPGGVNGSAAEVAAAALARKQDREREAMEAGTTINGAGGRMPSAQGDINELAGLVSSLGGSAAGGSGGPRAMPPSNNVISGGPGQQRDPEDETGLSQDNKADFLRKARNKGGADNYVQSTRLRALSPFEIKAGWDIPAVMEQEVNSDLPGEIRALVRENVYDTASGQYLLIPQGSRLVGKYDSRVAYAQNALLVVWDRIIFPDASSIDLEGMGSQDVRGRSGMRDQVNHHYARLFGTAILSTAFSVSAVVAQNRRQSVFTLPSSQDVAASAAASEIARLGSAITRRNLNVQPTIMIRAGYRFSVRVHKDLLFEAPYRPFPQGGERIASAAN